MKGPRRTITGKEFQAFKCELLDLCRKYGVDLLSDSGHGVLEVRKLTDDEQPDSVIGLQVY